LAQLARVVLFILNAFCRESGLKAEMPLSQSQHGKYHKTLQNLISSCNFIQRIKASQQISGRKQISTLNMYHHYSINTLLNKFTRKISPEQILFKYKSVSLVK